MPNKILDREPWQRFFVAHAGKLLAATLFAAGGVTTYYLVAPDAGPTGARIESPADNATLVDANDKGASCADGFQLDVRVRTNEANGTTAILTSNGLRVGSGTVSGGLVTFSSVELGSSEDHVLVAQVGNARAVSSVKVRCAAHKVCKLLGPTWSPEHPTMNARKRGIDLDAGADAAADAATWVAVGGGDSYSSTGAPYQITVQTRSPIQAGGSYEVFVDGASAGRVAKMSFGIDQTIDGVPLSTDGSHTASIKCVDSDGSIGFSSKATFVVDQAPPQIAPLNIAQGYVFSSSMLVGGKMRICASTTSGDAVDLAEGQKAARLNFCAGVGTSTPSCSAVTTHGADPAFDGGVLPEGGALCDGATGCLCPTWSWCAAGQDAATNTMTGSVTCYNDAGTAVSTNNPLQCSGCPVGTTLTPVANTDMFNCVDGGSQWLGKAGCTAAMSALLPDGASVSLPVVWDGGCFTCPSDGGAGCFDPWTAGIDGGCRQCQYVLTDGGVNAPPWQCPWCDDSTRTRNGGCVDIACPGPSPFSLRLSLYDGARNVSTRIIEQVACQVDGPSIQIVDPPGGSDLEIVEDIAKRVLASSTSTAPRKDIDPVTPGAQYTVVVCTDAVEGTVAHLLAGLRGEAMTEIATATVHADAGVPGPCPYQRSVSFVSATLPESGEDGLGRLATPTELRIDMAGLDGGTASSPVVDLWVDSTAPSFSFPAGLCGSQLDAAPRSVRVGTNTMPVTVEITNEQGTSRHTITEFAPSEYF